MRGRYRGVNGEASVNRTGHSRVNVPVAYLKSIFDCGSDLIWAGLPSSKTETGHPVPSVERKDLPIEH